MPCSSLSSQGDSRKSGKSSLTGVHRKGILLMSAVSCALRARRRGKYGFKKEGQAGKRLFTLPHWHHRVTASSWKGKEGRRAMKLKAIIHDNDYHIATESGEIIENVESCKVSSTGCGVEGDLLIVTFKFAAVYGSPEKLVETDKRSPK